MPTRRHAAERDQTTAALIRAKSNATGVSGRLLSASAMSPKEEPVLARFSLTPTAPLDEVGPRPRRPEAPAQPIGKQKRWTRLQSPAATPWRSTFVTRLLAGLEEPRPRPLRPELVVLRHVSDCLDPAARPRALPNAFRARDVHRAVAAPTPREKPPPKRVFSLGLSGRPARPIAFAVVATMRTGFEVGPRVGCQQRTCWRRIGRRRRAEASRRSSPPLSLCTRGHDRPR